MRKLIKSSLYSQIIENVPICCVDALIVNNKKVLLLKRKNKPLKNKWCVPGGRIFKNESLVNAVQRKALEEIGLRVKIIKQWGVYEFLSKDSYFSNVKSGYHAIDIVFIVKLQNNKEIKIDKNHSEYYWTNKIKKEYPSFVKKILRDYFKESN